MGPSREACDRCHSMKTRCSRLPESQICARCHRLNIPCHYSPPGRTGRPLGSGKGRNAKRVVALSDTSPVARSPASDRSTVSCPGNLDDFSFFESQSCSSDDAMPLYLMDNLLTQNSGRNQRHTSFPSTVSTSPQSSRSVSAVSEAPSSFYYPPEHQRHMGYAQQTAVPELCQRSPPYADGGDQLAHIMAMQTRLTTRLNSLQSGNHAPEDVEDTYYVSEELIRILDSVGNSPQFPSLGWVASQRPAGIAVLLLSSCYFSLIHAYEVLVDISRRQLRNHETISQHSLQPAPGSANMGVGPVYLAMPRRPIAEVNLHIVAQSVQHLKAAMERFAACMATTQVNSPEAQQSLWSSMQTFEHGCSAVSDLARTTLSELQRREENIFVQMGTRAF